MSTTSIEEELVELRAIVADGGNVAAKYWGKLQSARLELSQTRTLTDKIIIDFEQYRITAGIAAAIYDATITQLTGERDRARDVAVLLEQELAAARTGRVSAP